MSRDCLAIHPGALGDVLLAAPALAHLRALGFRPTLAVAGRLVPLFDASGLVARAQDLEALRLDRLFQVPAPADALAPLAAFAAVVSWLGAHDAGYRANLARLGRPVVTAPALPSGPARRHASDHLLDTLAPLGPPPVRRPDARLHVDPDARRAAAAWLAAQGIAPGAAIVLQPGAGSAAKVWPGFAALARRLADASAPVVALAGPADDAALAPVLATGAIPAARVARDWPLARVAALLSLARGCVGNDSGPTHLAAAVGCPTVALFGPTDPVVWAPRGARVRVVASVGPAWAGVDVPRVAAALAAVLGPPPSGPGARAVTAGAGAGPP